MKSGDAVTIKFMNLYIIEQYQCNIKSSHSKWIILNSVLTFLSGCQPLNRNEICVKHVLLKAIIS